MEMQAEQSGLSGRLGDEQSVTRALLSPPISEDGTTKN